MKPTKDVKQLLREYKERADKVEEDKKNYFYKYTGKRMGRIVVFNPTTNK